MRKKDKKEIADMILQAMKQNKDKDFVPLTDKQNEEIQEFMAIEDKDERKKFLKKIKNNMDKNDNNEKIKVDDFKDIPKVFEITTSNDKNNIKDIKEVEKDEIIEEELPKEQKKHKKAEIEKEIKSSVEDDIPDEIIEKEKQEMSELAKIVEFLFNNLWKRRKTRLRQRSIAKLTTIDTLAQIYDVKFFQLWIDGYTEFTCSTEGKGRQEIVDITKFTIDKQTERDKVMLEAFGRR